MKCLLFSAYSASLVLALGLSEQSLLAQDSDQRLPMTNVSSLTAGGYHTCVLSNGEVYCWGYGLLGQLGNGQRQNQATPTLVQGLGNDVLSVVAGELHTCAVKNSGAVYCWGFSYTGAVGNGISKMDTGFGSYMIPSSTVQPGLVQGLNGIRTVGLAASRNSTCALSAAGLVYCWGAGGEFQLGDNKSGFANHTGKAQQVTMLPEPAKSIHGAENGFCAVTVRNRLFCWGYVTAKTQKSYPMTELTPTSGTINSLALGDAHSCYADLNHKVYCIGDNWYQQTGLADTAKTWTPLANESFVQLDSYKKTTCGITPSGTVKCWGLCLYGLCGSTENEQLITPTHGQDVFQFSTDRPTQILGVIGAQAIAVGARHACALLQGGAIKCWGSGFLGQLGSGQTRQASTPVNVVIKGKS